MPQPDKCICGSLFDAECPLHGKFIHGGNEPLPCREVEFQNIPIHTEEGDKIKEALREPYFIDLDLAAVEARVLVNDLAPSVIIGDVERRYWPIIRDCRPVVGERTSKPKRYKGSKAAKRASRKRH